MFTACVCFPGGGDLEQYCESTDNSSLRIDDQEYTFRIYSDSIFFTEDGDNLRVYYQESRLNAVTVDLRLRGALSGTLRLDSNQSMVVLREFSFSPGDTFRLESVSIITEAYQRGTCCERLWCSQNTPDELKATVLGVLRSGTATSVMHFEIDVLTREEEGEEC